MKVAFSEANLFYGAKKYPVERDEYFSPFDDFDLDGDLMEQAFKAIAMVSNASGGFTMKQCTLRVHEKFVSINGSGFNIKWGNVGNEHIADPIERAHAMRRILDESVLYSVPFDVRSNQYGDGWKTAIKCERT